jgi:hypothetical protein
MNTAGMQTASARHDGAVDGWCLALSRPTRTCPSGPGQASRAGGAAPAEGPRRGAGPRVRRRLSPGLPGRCRDWQRSLRLVRHPLSRPPGFWSRTARAAGPLSALPRRAAWPGRLAPQPCRRSGAVAELARRAVARGVSPACSLAAAEAGRAGAVSRGGRPRAGGAGQDTVRPVLLAARTRRPSAARPRRPHPAGPVTPRRATGRCRRPHAAAPDPAPGRQTRLRPGLDARLRGGVRPRPRRAGEHVRLRGRPPRRPEARRFR